jgi:hypothetical protein
VNDITPEMVAAAVCEGEFGWIESLQAALSVAATGSVLSLEIARWDGPNDSEVTRHFRAVVVEDLLPSENLLGTVRRKPNGCVLAVLWPSPPSPDRWMTTDMWGSCGYETDEAVKDWLVVGAVPFSPAAGFPLNPPEAAQAEQERQS